MRQLYKYLREFSKPVIPKDKHKKFRLASLRRLIPYMRSHSRKALFGSVFMVLLSLLALPSPYLMKLIFDRVIVIKDIGLLNLIILSLLGIQVMRAMFSILTEYHFSLFSQEIMLNLKKDLFYKILRLPLSFFDKNQTGYILSRIAEVDGLTLFFSNVSTKILISFFEFFFCLAILFYLSWKLTIISLGILPFFYFAARIYSRGIRFLARESYEKGAIISRQIQDSLSGADVIKYFTAEKRETEKIHSFLDEFKTVNIKRNITATFSSEILIFLGVLGGILVLWYSSLDIIQGSFTIGSYIAFSAYVGRLYGPTHALASLGLTFQPAAVALERVSDLMEVVGEEESENQTKIENIRREIEFKNVFFSYENKQVLAGINIKIRRGDKILLSGPNGSGKSTIAKLMLGLYRIEKGSILIDGYDINIISLSSLRERISIVSQNTFLFNDTIRNNILYSRPGATDEEIERAAELSGALSFIRGLDAGFDTEIGERGTKLSGGERQKISIARAILKNSDVIILDEATTHLDEESEKKIGRLIRNTFQHKTCIIISHKMLKNLRLDRIYFLKKGRLTHQDSY